MAEQWIKSGELNWKSEPKWGIWGIPEKKLRLLPSDMSGMRAIELGCGTGYVSSWMQRRGASVIGIDNSKRQLATANRLAMKHKINLKFKYIVLRIFILRIFYIRFIFFNNIKHVVIH